MTSRTKRYLLLLSRGLAECLEWACPLTNRRRSEWRRIKPSRLWLNSVYSIHGVLTEWVNGGHLGHYWGSGWLRLKMLAEWVICRLNRETCLLRYEEPRRLLLDAEGLLELRCVERATLRKGIKRGLLLDENGRRAAGLRVEQRCLFPFDRREEVLNGLCAVSRFGGTRGILGRTTRGRFFRSYGGHSAHYDGRDRDELTRLVELFSNSSRLSSIPGVPVCSSFVRLVLNSILLEMRIVKVFLQRVDEGDRCLFV